MANPIDWLAGELTATDNILGSALGWAVRGRLGIPQTFEGGRSLLRGMSQRDSGFGSWDMGDSTSPQKVHSSDDGLGDSGGVLTRLTNIENILRSMSALAVKSDVRDIAAVEEGRQSEEAIHRLVEQQPDEPDISLSPIREVKEEEKGGVLGKLFGGLVAITRIIGSAVTAKTLLWSLGGLATAAGVAKIAWNWFTGKEEDASVDGSPTRQGGVGAPPADDGTMTAAIDPITLGQWQPNLRMVPDFVEEAAQILGLEPEELRNRIGVGGAPLLGRAWEGGIQGGGDLAIKKLGEGPEGLTRAQETLRLNEASAQRRVRESSQALDDLKAKPPTRPTVTATDAPDHFDELKATHAKKVEAAEEVLADAEKRAKAAADAVAESAAKRSARFTKLIAASKPAQWILKHGGGKMLFGLGAYMDYTSMEEDDPLWQKILKWTAIVTGLGGGALALGASSPWWIGAGVVGGGVSTIASIAGDIDDPWGLVDDAILGAIEFVRNRSISAAGHRMLAEADNSDSNSPRRGERDLISSERVKREKHLRDRLEDVGYTEEQASAFVLNIQQESAFDEQAEGDHRTIDGEQVPTAFGIAQWREDRADKMKAHIGPLVQNGMSAFDAQVDFLIKELADFPSLAAGGAGDTMPLDFMGAFKRVLNKYENPAQEHKEKRIAQAAAWLLAQAEDFNQFAESPGGLEVVGSTTPTLPEATTSNEPVETVSMLTAPVTNMVFHNNPTTIVQQAPLNAQDPSLDLRLLHLQSGSAFPTA